MKQTKHQIAREREKKIRIGYVLKSADVGTLFSSRYSENSSHTHSQTPTHFYTHLRTPVHTCAHLSTLYTPAHTRAHLCIPTHIHVCLPTPEHTHAHPHAPTRTLRGLVVVVEVIVVDEFERINHM